MALEIEAKISISDPIKLERLLRELQSEPGPVALQTEAYFDTTDLSLKNGDKGMRIRIESLSEHSQTVFLTFKGPRHPGKLKVRTELEIEVSDANTTRAILEALGYQQTIRYQKRRANWFLDGCSIALDQVPYLGSFIEVEGESESQVQLVLGKLKLDAEPLIQEGYAALLCQELKERGIDPSIALIELDSQD